MAQTYIAAGIVAAAHKLRQVAVMASSGVQLLSDAPSQADPIHEVLGIGLISHAPCWLEGARTQLFFKDIVRPRVFVVHTQSRKSTFQEKNTINRFATA